MMIIVDVETTGLDCRKHSIVSIGAVDFMRPDNQFYQECRIVEGAVIETKALAVNGFTVENIRDPGKPTLEQTITSFLAWMETCCARTIAGENPSFDRDFLRASAERYRIYPRLGVRTIDLHTVCYTHYMSRGLEPPMKNRYTAVSADSALTYVGLPEEPRPHHALTGAKMEAEAFSRLIYGKCLLQDYERYPVPEHVLRTRTK